MGVKKYIRPGHMIEVVHASPRRYGRRPRPYRWVQGWQVLGVDGHWSTEVRYQEALIMAHETVVKLKEVTK